MEIERKFLVDHWPADLGAGVRIEQGYLVIPEDSQNGVEVRLRRIDERSRYLTVKGGSGLKRSEVEVSLNEEEFGSLWPLTEGRRLVKQRFAAEIPSKLKADLDRYEGTNEGLIIVEVEFPGEAEANAFQPPDWFGREVTGAPEFRNSRLARG